MFLGGSSHALRGVRIAGAGTNVWGRELEAGAAYALAFVNNGDATVAVRCDAACIQVPSVTFTGLAQTLGQHHDPFRDSKRSRTSSRTLCEPPRIAGAPRRHAPGEAIRRARPMEGESRRAGPELQGLARPSG